MSKYTIKTVNPEYTGGGIWIFWGELTDGNYYLGDDNGCIRVVSESPENFDESLYEEWQLDHFVADLENEERINFCNDMLDMIAEELSNGMTMGGFSTDEINFYRTYMAEL